MLEENVKRAIEILKILETKTCVEKIKVDSVPIWYFLRWRLYHSILGSLCENGSCGTIHRSISNVAKGTSKIYGINKKVILTSLIRCALTISKILREVRVSRCKFMYITSSSFFRIGSSGKKSDTILEIAEKKEKSDFLIIERATFSSRDRESLERHKDVIFMDLFLSLSFVKNILIKPKYNVENWEIFVGDCMKLNFKYISALDLIDMLMRNIQIMKQQIFIELTNAKLIFKLFKPKCIILTSGFANFATALCYEAKKHNVLVVELQHGLVNEYHVGYTPFLKDLNMKQAPLPDVIGLYGIKFKECILRGSNGYTSDRLQLLGCQEINEFVLKYRNQFTRNDLRKRVRKLLGIGEDEFVVTFTSQIFINTEMLQFIKLLVKRKIGFRIIVKLHPVEQHIDKNIYDHVCRHPFITVVDDNKLSLYEIICSSDLHCSISSTVITECLALGIPNIILGFENYFDVTKIIPEKAAIVVYTVEEFLNAVEKVKYDHQYKQLIIAHGYNGAKKLFYGIFDEQYNLLNNLVNIMSLEH